jgi:hypothetical protein
VIEAADLSISAQAGFWKDCGEDASHKGLFPHMSYSTIPLMEKSKASSLISLLRRPLWGPEPDHAN